MVFVFAVLPSRYMERFSTVGDFSKAFVALTTAASGGIGLLLITLAPSEIEIVKLTVAAIIGILALFAVELICIFLPSDEWTKVSIFLAIGGYAALNIWVELSATSYIDLAKFFLASFMFVGATLGFAVAFMARPLLVEMGRLENELDELRDLTVLQNVMVRSQLADLKERLRRQEAPQEIEFSSIIVNQGAPLLSMLFRRETSLFKWGMAGARLVQSVFNYWKKQQR